VEVTSASFRLSRSGEIIALFPLHQKTWLPRSIAPTLLVRSFAQHLFWTGWLFQTNGGNNSPLRGGSEEPKEFCAEGFASTPASASQSNALAIESPLPQ
jgi:hypothetical protein